EEGGSGVAKHARRGRLYPDECKAGRDHARGRRRQALLGRVGEDARAGRGRGIGQGPRRAQSLTTDAGRAMSATEHAAEAQAAGSRRSPALPEGPVEWTCKIASEIALVVMLVLIAVDIVTRSLFNFSFEVSDEVGGYMLVAIAFLSLSACHV